MNLWESVFSQSPVNDGYYDEDDLPHQRWEWPKATWFQARRNLVREHRQLWLPTAREGCGMFVKCQRCNNLWGSEAVARIRSDILDLKVCGRCAKEAFNLGLSHEPLADLAACRRPAASAAASH